MNEERESQEVEELKEGSTMSTAGRAAIRAGVVLPVL